MPTRVVVNNLPVLNRVIAHWVNVEAIVANSVSVPDGMSLAEARELAGAILEAEGVLIEARNILSQAQGMRNMTRGSVHSAARQARKSLVGQVGNVTEVKGLPALPVVSSAAAKLLQIYTDIANVWERVNGLPAASVPAARLPLRIPLTENDALVQLDLAGFQTRIETFRSAAEAVKDGEAAVTVKIRERDVLHKRAASLVKSYGSLVRGLLPAGHPLLSTIPTLTGG
jgi:hypothetical protein